MLDPHKRCLEDECQRVADEDHFLCRPHRLRDLEERADMADAEAGALAAKVELLIQLLRGGGPCCPPAPTPAPVHPSTYNPFPWQDRPRQYPGSHLEVTC